jgi:predicted cupin superfamily sugar epimerase
MGDCEFDPLIVPYHCHEMKTMTADEIITQLQLIAHPEGGYYAETYRSEELTINKNGDSRSTCTAIYFLLKDNDLSHLHRIQSDELWFFHQGEPLEIVYIQHGKISSIVLGNNLQNGEVPQAIIPAHVWFGSRLKNGKDYALVSCTVAPGFDFHDFELAERSQLLKDYPHLHEPITAFTR